jgi:hypothetical protein
MSALNRFLRMSGPERLLLLRVAALQCAIRLALRLIPFRRVIGAVNRLSNTRIHGRARTRFPPEQLARAVSMTSGRLFRDAPCLTQALAVKVLYCRRGFPASVRIGVRRLPESGFEAHAWVESGGCVVVGFLEDLSTFEVLPDLEAWDRRRKP